MNVPSVYLAMADAETFVPRESARMGLLDPKVAALRCFRRYSKDATFDMPDAWGAMRWLTHKQMRVYGVLSRLAVSGQVTTMRAVAEETGTCPSTVSRSVLRFSSWGLFSVDVTRGRNGGMKVRAQTVMQYVERARVKIAELARKVVFRAQRVNVASLETTYRKDMETLRKTLTYRDATFSEYMAWREDRGVQTAPPER